MHSRQAQRGLRALAKMPRQARAFIFFKQLRHKFSFLALVSISGLSNACICAEEIRSYFIKHLQSKEDTAQTGVEEAPDPEDLAAQVSCTLPTHTCIPTLDLSQSRDVPDVHPIAGTASLQECGPGSG